MMRKSNKKRKKYVELSHLKGLIRQKSTSYREISEQLCISVHSFSDKINGYYCFDAEEIENISKLLGITADEVAKYFFPSMLKFSA